MTERPVLFNADMVRCILSGTKTQTRRAVRPQPVDRDQIFQFGEGFSVGRLRDSENAIRPIKCPLGAPGDRLWVRETFGTLPDGRLVFAADQEGTPRADAAATWAPGWRWTPSIHMPRAASRINLEVTDVRAQRLQDITEEDALAEGIDDAWLVRHHNPPPRKLSFQNLWLDTGGDWKSNPWVWAVTFRRIEDGRS